MDARRSARIQWLILPGNGHESGQLLVDRYISQGNPVPAKRRGSTAPQQLLLLLLSVQGESMALEKSFPVFYTADDQGDRLSFV